MRWLVTLLAIWPTLATADGVTRVKAKLADQRIALTVTYSVKVAEPSVGSLDLDVPTDASITGARVTVGGRTHTLGFQPASTVGAALDDLTRGEAGTPTRSAFAIEARTGLISLAYAVPKAGVVKLVLDVDAPGCWYRDARYALVPEEWARLAKSKVTEEPACVRPRGDGEAWIKLADRRKQRLTVSAPAADVLDKRYVAIELVVGAPVSEVPPDLSTVLLVDGSRSMTREQLAAQRALVASYLTQVARTKVQVVTFARTAKALLPAWSTARDVDAKIDLALEKLVPANGSAIDAAITEAATWLARAKGTRRVVVFTDGLLARAVTKQVPDLATRLPAGTLVHVVTVDAATPLWPDDRSPLGELARDTQGRAYVGSGDATIVARPTSFDQVRFEGAGWDLAVTTCDASLAEGTSCSMLASARSGAGELSVHGTLWSEPVLLQAVPDLSRSTAALRELLPYLGDEELRRAAKVVTDEQWLYAEHGAPSTYGDAWALIETGRYGTTCRDCAAPAPAYDRVTTLAHRGQPLLGQLELATEGCRDRAAIEVEVDVTGLEIADVIVPTGVPATQQQCIETALWGASLAPYPPTTSSPVKLRILPLQ